MIQAPDKILVLGAASWNRLVHVDELPQGQSATIFGAREIEAAGSTGVGKAMALTALGSAPKLHCTLGKDDHAEQVIAACTDRGIELLIDRHDGPTAHHLNLMDQHGGRFSIILSNGPDHPVIDEKRIAHHIATASTIFLSLAPSSAKILHLLEGCDAEVLLDLHDYDGHNPWYDGFIANADVIQLSDVALSDVKPVVDRLLSGRAHQVVVTKAAAGAEVFRADHHEIIPPCPAKMVDSNGAGDAFSVALWWAQRQGDSLDEAGKFAASAAAFAVEHDALFPADVTVELIRARAHRA